MRLTITVDGSEIQWLKRSLRLDSRLGSRISTATFDILGERRWAAFTIPSDWLVGWSKRIKFTIDHNDIDATLSNFPILVYLSTSSGRNSDDISCIFDELTGDGNHKKIAITTSDGKTQCYVEIEKWDDANEKAWLWVKVPALASDADTDLYLYYDKTKADNDAYVGDPNSTPAENVWDANFKLVCHMRDDPDTSHVRDSTDNNNDGTKKGAGEPAVTTAGKIDDAQNFDGDDDYTKHGDILDFGANQDFTIAFWQKKNSATGWGGQVSKGSGIEPSYVLIVGNNALLGDVIRFVIKDASAQTIVDSTGTIADTDWHHIALVANRSGNADIYIDGALDAGSSIISASDGDLGNADDFEIGRDRGQTVLSNALMDEVCISDIARTAAWIKASYESERDHLLDFGSEEWGTGIGASLAVAKVLAIGGFILPHDKAEVIIDRTLTPMNNCAVGRFIAMGGESHWLDNFFGGYIASIDHRLIGNRRIYRITAQDYNVLTTQVLVTKSYAAKTQQFIIDDLFTTYLPEIDTSTYVESDATTITLDWTRIFLDKALDELASIMEKEWNIDHDKKLHYFTPVTTAAPFTLSSSPWGTINIGYDGFQYVEDNSKIINKVTVVGNFLDSGDTIQDGGGINAVQTTIDVTAGGNFSIGETIRVDSEHCRITDIVVNTLTVIRGVDGTDAVVHANGLIIFTRIETTRTDNASHTYYDRWYEAKHIDSNINSLTWAQLVGDAILTESAFGKVRGRLTCHQEGLVVGQKVSIYNFWRGINAYYLIQAIRLGLVNVFTEKVDIEYGDYSPNLIDLLLKIKKEEEKE